MDDLETGKDKIKKICELLKNETLEPAKQEAQKIIEVAQAQAHEIVLAAEKKIAELNRKEREKMERERELFQASLVSSSKQAVEMLKQEIENTLFNRELTELVKKSTKDPQGLARLIEVLVKAIEKEGIKANFSVLIPESIPAEKVNSMIAKEILEKLREKSVVLGKFAGGVQVKLHDKKVTLDMSDEALNELLGKYLRADFRKILFHE